MVTSEEVLKKTIKVWQPHYKEPLTLQDAQEIIDNACGLIRLLDRLDRKYQDTSGQNGQLGAPPTG